MVEEIAKVQCPDHGRAVGRVLQIPADAARRWYNLLACRPSRAGLAARIRSTQDRGPGYGPAQPARGRGDGGFPDADLGKGVTLKAFFAYMPMHNYIYAPTRDHWPASSVDARIPPVKLVDRFGKPLLDKKGKPKTMPASAWLDSNKPVEQMTWAPGEPMLVRYRLMSDGGWIKRKGVTVFNLYRPPILVPRTGNVTLWLELVDNVFPTEAERIILWLAHRVQRPHEKINHALVLGGKPGIGKDTILEPVREAVGPWNFADISPKKALGDYCVNLKSVILCIHEARDLGEYDRFAFYEHMKPIIAAPPPVLQVNEKYLREYYVPNLTGVVITTNNKTNGIYLPADDR